MATKNRIRLYIGSNIGKKDEKQNDQGMLERIHMELETVTRKLERVIRVFGNVSRVLRRFPRVLGSVSSVL